MYLNHCWLVVRQARTRETRRQTERQVRKGKVGEQKESRAGSFRTTCFFLTQNFCHLLFKMFLLVKISRKPFFYSFFLFYLVLCFSHRNSCTLVLVALGTSLLHPVLMVALVVPEGTDQHMTYQHAPHYRVHKYTLLLGNAVSILEQA